MPDPFSVAAGTAGVVSFGLEVCSGLVAYCRAWKSYDRDIEAAFERLTSLHSTLKSLSTILITADALDDNTTRNLSVARDSISSCSTDLHKLDLVLIECESINQPAGVFDKVHNFRIRSSAFFNKNKLRKLNESVMEIQRKLDSAIQIFKLQLEMTQNVKLEQCTSVQQSTVDQLPKIEKTLLKQLEINGRQLSALHEGVLHTSVQHIKAIEEVTESIAALQLAMIKKPSLQRSVMEEACRLPPQRTVWQRQSKQECSCPAQLKSRQYGRKRCHDPKQSSLRARWNANVFSSSLLHRKDCMLSQNIERRGIRISCSGPLLRGALEASLSMTRGSGGFSISPALTFNYIVPSNTGPFNIILDMNELYWYSSSVTDLQISFRIQIRELVRLYQDGRASPTDIDEYGDTIMHKACKYFPVRTFIDTSEASNISNMYIEFLRDLQSIGIPLNNTNAAGLTPFGQLIRELRLAYQWLPILKTMLDLGAELSFVSENNLPTEPLKELSVLAFGDCLDLAEAFGCNEICLAVAAKDLPWLVKAVHRHPECIDQQNSGGQTPLHISVCWPNGLKRLLKVGADANIADDRGRTPIFYASTLLQSGSFDVLAEKSHLLYREFYWGGQSYNSSLLEEIILSCHFRTKAVYGPRGVSEEDAEAFFDSTIRLVVERRRALEALIRVYLDPEVIQRLQLSDETILDRKASYAISLLSEKIEVPGWLINLTREHGTVYHIHSLTSIQAQKLWDIGFREFDEPDSRGFSPIMCHHPSLQSGSACWLGTVAWLIEKGADIHRKQRYTFRKGEKEEWPPKMIMTNECSSTTALHYVASFWACTYNDGLPWTDETLSRLTQKMLKTVFHDELPDSCICACSTIGCRAFTMFAKTIIGRGSWHKSARGHGDRFLSLSQALAQYLDVDQPSYAWLRQDMIRFLTFRRLDLDHTCCNTDQVYESWNLFVIYEQYTNEEILEIHEEQAERLEQLEALLVEFESKFNELDIPFNDFLSGYWRERMIEVDKEAAPIDHAALENMGVRLRRASSASSHSSDRDENLTTEA